MVGLAFLLIVNVPLTASSQWQDITFEIEDRHAFYSPEDGVSRFSTDVVLADHNAFHSMSSGFTLLMAYDPSAIEVRSVAKARLLLSLNDNHGPDFFAVTIDPAGIVVVGVVASFMEMGGLDYRSAPAVVTLNGESLPLFIEGNIRGDKTEIIWAEEYTSPETGLVNNYVILGDGSVRPTETLDGTITFTPAEPFRRSDAVADGRIDIGDAIEVILFLFKGQPSSCHASLDANDDDAIDVADTIFLLSYLFGNGPTPSAPFPYCGFDQTLGTLTCEDFPLCP